MTVRVSEERLFALARTWSGPGRGFGVSPMYRFSAGPFSSLMSTALINWPDMICEERELVIR